MANPADYVYYKLVYDYLIYEIDDFSEHLIGHTMAWASAVALTLVTLWILIQGFRIATGRSRDSLMSTVVDMGRIAVIVAAATTMAIAGTDIRTLLTKDIDKAVHYMFTGHNGNTSDAIDENLAYTQLALSTINVVKVNPGDTEMQNARDRSALIATFGTASPPMAAGAMLLIYHFAMALFIGLGPLFILCLMFPQTKDLFKRWLMYGIGTTFSMALLSVVVGIVLKLTVKISIALWGAKIINSLIGNSTEGLTSTAMQQGGIGLLLTALIVSVPPMAAMFFQGTLGSFMSYSAFNGGSNSPGPQGQPPGAWTKQSGAPELALGTKGAGYETPSFESRVSGSYASVTTTDHIKTSRPA